MYLGNLSIDEFIRRTGYKFSDEDYKWLNNHRQNDAHVKFDSNNLHIFDIPFCIHAASNITAKLIEILEKYDKKTPTKEKYSVIKVTETEEQRYMREKLDKEIEERKSREENPNSIWLVKYHMFIPVNVQGRELYYGCFVNILVKGKDNIPKIIDGRCYISRTTVGFSGKFWLFNEDENINVDYDGVIGSGLYDLNGNFLNVSEYTFDEVEFNISDGIKNYESFRIDSKEIYFSKIAE